MKVRARENTRNLSLVALFTTLIIIGAYIKIPIPYIPFTLQTLFVNMAMLMLGAKWGALSVIIYVGMGLIGIPVFTAGGGWGYVFHPTFGYLIGFLLGVIAGGLTLRALPNKFWSMTVASVINIAVIYACGMAYFYFIQTFYLGVGVTAKTVLISCFLVFLPGDTLSALLGCYIAKRLNKYRILKLKADKILSPPPYISESDNI